MACHCDELVVIQQGGKRTRIDPATLKYGHFHDCGYVARRNTLVMAVYLECLTRDGRLKVQKFSVLMDEASRELERRQALLDDKPDNICPYGKRICEELLFKGEQANENIDTVPADSEHADDGRLRNDNSKDQEPAA